MPIYEYRCGACGHELEALQKVSDKPLKACPSCGKRALKRLMSAPRFRLKGAGWYETDFKSDKDKKRNLAETGSEGAASTSDSGGSDASSGDKADDRKSDKASDKTSAKGDSGDKGGKASGPKPAAKGTGSRPAVRKPAAVRKRSRRRRA